MACPGLAGPLAAGRFEGWFRRGFAKLRQLSDVKQQGVRQSVGRGQSQFALARLRVGGDRQLQGDLVGQHRMCPLVLKVVEFVADFHHLPDGFGIFGLFSQLLQLLPQFLDLFRRQRFFALDDFGLNAAARDIHVRGTAQILSADGDADGIALSAAGRIRVAHMWRVRLCHAACAAANATDNTATRYRGKGLMGRCSSSVRHRGHYNPFEPRRAAAVFLQGIS